MSRLFYTEIYPNRTACDILSEMRTCSEYKNYAPMDSLIEEMQLVANRMEAGLGDKRDMADMLDKKSKLKQQIKELELTKIELKQNKKKKKAKKGAKE